MQAGKRLAPAESVQALRDRARAEVQRLHPEFRRLRNPERYWVGLSEALALKKQAEMERMAGEYER
ncbi:MAG: hypothetical protein M5U26_06635 [Planctomycetota bacterium]|nr:hypothetical protein [Planctomycetota bacterium]